MNKKHILSLLLLGSLGISSMHAIDTNLILGSALVVTSALSGLIAGCEFNLARQPVYLPKLHPNDTDKVLGRTPYEEFTDLHTALQRQKTNYLGNVVYPRFCRKIGYISGSISLVCGLAGGYLLKNNFLK